MDTDFRQTFPMPPKACTPVVCIDPDRYAALLAAERRCTELEGVAVRVHNLREEGQTEQAILGHSAQRFYEGMNYALREVLAMFAALASTPQEHEPPVTRAQLDAAQVEGERLAALFQDEEHL